jgi:hypothetical protein
MQSPHTGNKLELPFNEILKSIPEFLGFRVNEEPSYHVVSKEGSIEVRRYPSMTTASVTVDKNFDNYREEAFRRLASYIFGENSGKSSLSMTAPVLQMKSHPEKLPMTAPVLHETNGAGWTMSFLLPAKLTAESAPQPIDPKISLKDIPSRTIVALRYSGSNSLEMMDKQQKKLQAWLVGHIDAYRPLYEPFFAQYDAPFILPFLRRNEVQVEVREMQG